MDEPMFQVGDEAILLHIPRDGGLRTFGVVEIGTIEPDGQLTIRGDTQQWRYEANFGWEADYFVATDQPEDAEDVRLYPFCEDFVAELLTEQEVSQPDGVQMQCSHCGKCVIMDVRDNGSQPVIMLDAICGWIYTTEEGWACGQKCHDALVAANTAERPSEMEPAKLEDYHRHISDTHEERKGFAICGRKTEPGEWEYADVDHAFLSIPNDSIQPCPRCVAKVLEVFLNAE